MDLSHKKRMSFPSKWREIIDDRFEYCFEAHVGDGIHVSNLLALRELSEKNGKRDFSSVYVPFLMGEDIKERLSSLAEKYGK